MRTKASLHDHKKTCSLINVLSCIALFLCLIGLCVPSFLAVKEINENLLMILPAQPGSPKIDVQRIEEFLENEFLITYQIPGAARINLPHGEFPVTVIGTNSGYSRLILSVISEGSFFSRQAWSGRQRHAVLNEKAAFAIFGSSRIAGNQFKINNETWIVTGVIKDGNDEQSRVYVPSSINGGGAGELLALMAANGYNEAYIKNSIRTLGVHEGNFNFYNLGVHVRQLWERIEITVRLFFALLFISLLRPVTGKFLTALADIKKKMEHRYIGEIFREDRKSVIRLALTALVILILPSVSLVLFLKTVSIILPWQDIPSLNGLNHELFSPYLVRLFNFELASRILFILALVFLAVFFITSLLRPIHSLRTTAVKVSN